jgi:DNA-binding protein Alba
MSRESDMMTSVIQQMPDSTNSSTRVIPPSVLIIGKKRALDYIAPALFRLNNIGELVIKATGSLSIVTAVDVAEIVKRDSDIVATSSIELGTDAFVISTGETRRMSCIEIKLVKTQWIPEVPDTKAVDIVVAKPSEIMLAKTEPVLEVPATEVIKAVTTQPPDSTTAVKKKRTAKRSGAKPKAKKKMIRKKRAPAKK